MFNKITFRLYNWEDKSKAKKSIWIL